jgi:N-acetyl-anhydromuramyl-L-alanine amidase AmpD
MRRIDLIVIHCTASRPDQHITMEQLDQMHKARGWKCCGYHYYITRDGQLHFGRPEEMVGAHARHYNAHSIGICYEGGLDEKGRAADTRTPAQKLTLHSLLIALKADYPNAEIVGHCELPEQRMPSELVRSWLSRDGSRPSHLEGVHKACPCFSCSEYRDYFERNAKLA